MTVMTIKDGEYITVKATIEGGKVGATAGPLAGYVEDLKKDFPGLTDKQLVNRFEPRHQITIEEDGDMTVPEQNMEPGEVPAGRPMGKVRKSDPDDMEFGEVGTLAKINEDERLVFGWAYVSHDRDGKVVVDKSGEFIDDVKELEKAAYDFVIKTRVAGERHSDNDDGSVRQVGTMVESVIFTPDKVAKMGIAPGVLPSGWWVGFRVDDDAAWQDVREGKHQAFSIRGKALRKEV